MGLEVGGIYVCKRTTPPPHPPQGRNKARLEPGYRTPIIAQVAWVRGTAVGWRERDLLGDI